MITKSLHVLKYNALFSFLSQVIRLAANILLFLGIARFYGTEAFGQFTTAHSLATLFLILADFGFDALIATEIASNPSSAQDIIGRYFPVKVIFAFSAALLMAGLPLVHSFSQETAVLIWFLTGYVLFSSLSNFFFSYFKGIEQLHLETIISFCVNTLFLVLLAISGALQLSLHVIASVFVVTRIFGFIAASKLASKRIKVVIGSVQLKNVELVWMKIATFGLLSLFGSLCMLQDTILLAFMKSDREVGIYQAAFKLAALIMLIPEIATAATLPALSRLFSEKNERWLALGLLLNKTFVFIALVISMVLFVYAGQMISFIYGTKDFAEAIPILRVFAFIVLIRYSVEAFGLMLTTSNNQSKRMLVVLIATLVNFGLNLYMIPNFGPMGAVIVSLATNIVIAVGYIYSTRVIFSKWIADLRSAVPILFTVVVTACVWQLRLLPIAFILPPAIALCCSVIFFIGYTKEERKLVFALRGAIPPR